MSDKLILPDGWVFHENLVQNDLERFEAAMDKEDEIPPSSIATRARLNARWVRTAINAGWLQSCPYKAREIGDQSPAEIAQAAIAISAIYYEATSVPEKKF